MPQRGTAAAPQGTLSTGTLTYGPSKARRKAQDAIVFGVILTLIILFLTVGAKTVGLSTLATMATGNGNNGAASGASSATSGGHPEITEIMAGNKGTITAQDGKYYDWIELYNPTDKAVNLAGYTLSDNPKKPLKFVLPARTLEPGKYVLVFASRLTSTGTEIDANFSLKSSGATLMLSDPSGQEVQSVTYPELQKNNSYAMDASNAANWSVTDKSTPGYPNTSDGYADFQQTRHATAAIGIDEVMAGNRMTTKDQDGDYSDWVEISNPTNAAVDLTGWGLSNKESDPKSWVFPAMKIDPGQHVVVFLSGKNRSQAGQELHANFRLNATKDMVLLSNFQGQIVSEVPIDNMKADTSMVLDPATGKWQPCMHPTPGQPNTEEGWNVLQSQLYSAESAEPIVINEVMSNNASTLADAFQEYPDWIELYNRSDKDVNLKGWGLTNSSNKPGLWVFPDITLGPKQYLTVFASGRDLKDANAVAQRQLHTNFKLSGSGGIVALTAPDGHVADRCFAPMLKAGETYGRTQDGSLFNYITTPTPGASNAKGYPGRTADPVFSVQAGMYDTAQQVALTVADPQAKLYYTTDGSTPTAASTPYTAPISVQKSTAIRAVALRSGYLPSDVACSTFLINEGIKLPVVSIVTDPGPMFNPTTGLYEKGPNASSTFPYTGANFFQKTELPAHLELLNTDGSVELSQDLGLRMFGQYSRGEAYKGLALIARSIYGKNSLDDVLFPDQPYTSYKSFVLKPGGQDVNRTGIRDVVIGSLVRDTTSDTLYVQDYRTVALFVNGEFWGVNEIREKVNTHTIAQHYKVDETKLDILEGNGSIVKAGSNKDYYALLDYVKNHDLSVQANYDYVASKVDIDSIIDWYACEICSGNSDMGNDRFWKTETPDGKWRWIYYDFCWGFNSLSRSDIQNDLNPAGNGANHAFSTALINGLLKNDAFKQKFLQRLAYHITVTFDPTRVVNRIDEISSQIQPYMDRDFKKWGFGTEQTWAKQVQSLRDYAQQHPALLKQQMKDYFHLSDAKMQQLFKQ